MFKLSPFFAGVENADVLYENGFYKITFPLEMGDGRWVDHVLPGKIVLCENCDGEGRHLMNSLRGIAFSPEDEEPDFIDDMRSGCYDQTCETCNGQGRVIGFDNSGDNNKKYKDALDRVNWVNEAVSEYYAEMAAERRYFGY